MILVIVSFRGHTQKKTEPRMKWDISPKIRMKSLGIQGDWKLRSHVIVLKLPHLFITFQTFSSVHSACFSTALYIVALVHFDCPLPIASDPIDPILSDSFTWSYDVVYYFLEEVAAV